MRLIDADALVDRLVNAPCKVDEQLHYAFINTMLMYVNQSPTVSEKSYTKADYIMALHKEYGCSFTRAEEAHNKALEYLQDEMMMKG